MLARKAVRARVPLPGPLRKLVQRIAIKIVSWPIISVLVGYCHNPESIDSETTAPKLESPNSNSKVAEKDASIPKPPTPLSKVITTDDCDYQ